MGRHERPGIQEASSMTFSTDLKALLTAPAGLSPGGTVTLGADVISENLHLVPVGAFPVLGLYVTQVGGGTGFIAATPAQLAAHPDCVKYGQLPSGDPFWVDVLDKEAGAATDQEVKDWAHNAQSSFTAGTHPGQRMPAIYVSANGVSQVANDLVAAGVTSGIGLIIANWNLSEAQAAADVIAHAGPFPIVGLQYRDPGPYDLDVYLTEWLLERSGPKPPANTYGPPLNLLATGGDTSVKLTWEPPGTQGLPDPTNYDIFMYRGTAATRTSELPSYPRTEPSATTEQVGSLQRATTYTAHVVASGKNGTMVRPFTYASVTFSTV